MSLNPSIGPERVSEFPEYLVARFWSKVDKEGPTMAHMATNCWEWKHQLERGYGRMWWPPEQRVMYAHQISWLLATGILIDGLVVRHHCDNRACQRPEHLAEGPQADNVKDAYARGRMPTSEQHSATMLRVAARGDRNGSRTRPDRMRRGEASPVARLTVALVSDMRRAYAAGEDGPAIAARLGLPFMTAWCAIIGRHWAHVTEPPPCVGRPRGGRRHR